MGMFDEVRAINVSHKNFDKKHNGYTFQTKNFENDGIEYCIFNGVLYKETERSNGYKRYDYAQRLYYSGKLNIYNYVKENDIEYWIEYDLYFSDGELIDVTPYEVSVMSDHRDMSKYRPSKPSNRLEITINISNLTREKQNAFVEFINDEKLNMIRDILNEPSATIFFPVKRTSPMGLPETGYPQIVTIASVMQRKEDFMAVGENMKKITTPHGDEMTLFLDEAGYFLGQSHQKG